MMIDNLIKRQRVYVTGGVYANMMVKMVKYFLIHCRAVRDKWGTVVNYLLTNDVWHGSVPTRQFQLDNIMLQQNLKSKAGYSLPMATAATAVKVKIS